MTLESNRNLGGIGAILLVVAAVALFAQPLLGIIGIVGVILMLIALHGLADYYQEKSIFRNGLYGFIALIIGVIVAFVSFAYLILFTSYFTDLFALVYPGFNGDWTAVPNLTPNTNLNPADIVPFVGPMLSILAVGWVFAMVASFFTWRSLRAVASKSTVNLFSTAGILLLIGSVLVIAFGLGAILMWIAALLIAMAFFQLKPLPDQTVAFSPPTA